MCVGHTTPDQQNPTPLIIEWVPDVLPFSRVGELKITFEFGHQPEPIAGINNQVSL